MYAINSVILPTTVYCTPWYVGVVVIIDLGTFEKYSAA